jgi:hypothetical protein
MLDQDVTVCHPGTVTRGINTVMIIHTLPGSGYHDVSSPDKVSFLMIIRL